MVTTSHRARLMAGGAFLALFAGGYGQRAYAQAANCVGPVDDVITCSGDASPTGDDAPQVFGDPHSLLGDTTIVTEPGFSIDTSNVARSNAIYFAGSSLTVTDDNASDITGDNSGLSVNSPDVTINSAGSINATNGRALTIRGVTNADVTIGDVSGNGGIYVDAGYNPSDIRITVTGDLDGGTGEAFEQGHSYADTLNLTVDGNVTSARGIDARTDGTGSSYVTIGGDLTNNDAESGYGINADGYSADMHSTAVSITNTNGTITGATNGINAVARGAGAVRISVNNVTTQGEITNNGITAVNTGTGGIYVESTGLITSGSFIGLSVTSADNGGYGDVGQINLGVNDINAGNVGIYVTSNAYQSVQIQVNGDVTGGQYDYGLGTGIVLTRNGNQHGASNNRLGIFGTVSSDNDGYLSLVDNDGATSLSLYAGGALTDGADLGNYNDQLIMRGGDLNDGGVIDGGDGYDSVRVEANSTLLGANIVGFETLLVGGGKRIGIPLGLDAPGAPLSNSVIAQFSTNDTLTLGGTYASATVAAGGVLSSGDTLVINAPTGVELIGARRVVEVSPVALSGLGANMLLPGPYFGNYDSGILRTGGAAGASTITVNTTEAGGGVNGGGLIDMQNGAVGDQVVVNGQVVLGALDGADVLRVDIDPAVAEGDILTVNGNLGLSGNINVNVINIDQTGVSDHVVARSNGGIARLTDVVDPVLTASTDSVAAEVEARLEGQEFIVQVTTDFTPEAVGTDGLSGNGTAFGDYLNEVLNDPALADVRALALGANNIEELEALFGELSGTDLNAPIVSSAEGGIDFGSSLFSCTVGEGQNAAIDEGQCGWTRIGGTYTDRDSSAGNPGGNQTIFSVSAGGQIEYSENIRLGAGIGYAKINSNGDAGGDVDGDRISIGASAKYVDGPFVAGVSLGGGVTFTDTDRRVGAQTARADFEIYDFSAIVRAAYLLDVGNGIYVKPQIQGGATLVSREGFTENGAGAGNLTVQGETQTFLHAAPSVEIGGDFQAAGMTVRPYVRLGATILSEDEVDTTARFAAAGVATNFTTTVERDDFFGEIDAGVVLFTAEDVSLRAEYQGRLSSDTTSHGGFLKLQIDF